MEKKCIKCGEERHTSQFYTHNGMKDGLINKCKNCCKESNKELYNKKSLDDEWIKKERKRCVDRNRRLGYNKKYKLDSMFNESIYKNLSRNYNVLRPYEIHHWNYNSGFEEDFIILEMKEHRKSHMFINRKKGEYLFKDDSNNILYTKESHIMYLKSKGICIFREF